MTAISACCLIEFPESVAGPSKTLAKFLSNFGKKSPDVQAKGSFTTCPVTFTVIGVPRALHDWMRSVEDQVDWTAWRVSGAVVVDTDFVV